MMSYISGMDDPASQYLQRWVLKVRCQIFIVGLSIEKQKDSIVGKSSRKVYQ